MTQWHTVRGLSCLEPSVIQVSFTLLEFKKISLIVMGYIVDSQELLCGMKSTGT